MAKAKYRIVERRILAYSYLRRVPGRKRRIRVYVYKVIRVRLLLKTPRPRLKGRKKPVLVPKRRLVRKRLPPKPKRATRKSVDAATRGAIEALRGGQWLGIDEYLTQLEHDIADTDPAAKFEIDDPVYRLAGVPHWISTDDLLVWESKLKSRSMEAFGFSNIWVIRVWALLYHSNTGDYHVICRARSFRMTKNQAERAVTSYTQAKSEADDIFEAVKDWSEKNTDYGQVVGPMIAWTFWGGGKDSVKTDPATGHLAPQGEVAPREGLPFK